MTMFFYKAGGQVGQRNGIFFNHLRMNVLVLRRNLGLWGPKNRLVPSISLLKRTLFWNETTDTRIKRSLLSQMH